MIPIWYSFIIQLNWLTSDEKFQWTPHRSSSYSYISFLNLRKTQNFSYSTGNDRNNPWTSGNWSRSKAWVCVCTVPKQKNSRPQLLSDPGLLDGTGPFGKPRYSGRWHYVMDTTAALILWLIQLQTLVMFAPLQRSRRPVQPPGSRESLPHALFVTKHFLSLLAPAIF